MPSVTASHARPAIRLRSSAAAQLPAIRSDSSSNPPSTTTAEVPAWRCWVAMAPQVAARPARSRSISPAARQQQTQQQRRGPGPVPVFVVHSRPPCPPRLGGAVLRFWPGPRRAGRAQLPAGGNLTVRFGPRPSRPGRPPRGTAVRQRPAPARSTPSTRQAQRSSNLSRRCGFCP